MRRSKDRKKACWLDLRCFGESVCDAVRRAVVDRKDGEDGRNVQ